MRVCSTHLCAHTHLLHTPQSRTRPHAQTEDYFLSASYFDEGRFTTSQSGLTYKTGSGGIASYKVHTRDLVLWSDGFNLTWRNMEDASCPTGWKTSSEAEAVRSPPLSVAPATYNTLVWYYTWSASEVAPTPALAPAHGAAAGDSDRARLAVVAQLLSRGHIAAHEAVAATAALMRSDAVAAKLAALLDVQAWSGVALDDGASAGQRSQEAEAVWEMVAAGVRTLLA